MSICNLIEVFDPPELLTPQEAADYLGVARRTIDRWRFAGKGPTPTRVETPNGPRYWYEKADLDAHIRKGSENAPVDPPTADSELGVPDPPSNGRSARKR